MQPEQRQGREQGVAALLSQLQPGDAGAGFGGDRRGDGGQGVGAGDRVVADRLDAQQGRLAVKPISRSAGRLVSRLPIEKSVVSLMVVSVRNALRSLWYCLIRVCL